MDQSPEPGGSLLEPKELSIPDTDSRTARRDRQAHELEKNQTDLRASIAESKRLVDQANAMIRRHRDECEAAESDGQ